MEKAPVQQNLDAEVTDSLQKAMGEIREADMGTEKYIHARTRMKEEDMPTKDLNCASRMVNDYAVQEIDRLDELLKKLYKVRSEINREIEDAERTHMALCKLHENVAQFRNEQGENVRLPKHLQDTAEVQSHQSAMAVRAP